MCAGATGPVPITVSICASAGAEFNSQSRRGRSALRCQQEASHSINGMPSAVDISSVHAVITGFCSVTVRRNFRSEQLAGHVHAKVVNEIPGYWAAARPSVPAVQHVPAPGW